jgi:acyl carrier protein
VSEAATGRLSVSSHSEQIRAYIAENFLFGAEGVTDETSLLDEGYIDSTSVLEIVGHLEERYGISVKDEELVPENFGSIANLTAYLARKLDGH